MLANGAQDETGVGAQPAEGTVKEGLPAGTADEVNGKEVKEQLAALAADGSPIGAKKEGANGSVVGAETAAVAEPDTPMQDAAPLASSVQVSEAETRENTPALSEAGSELSVATSAAGTAANGAGAAATVFDPTSHDGLAFPFSAYNFANTALVPVASTSTTPFSFQNFPPKVLEESWARSKRSDDPEAYEPPDREAGYFLTEEELVAAKEREAARMAKVQARLAKLEWYRKGKGREEATPPAAPPLSGRAATKSRAMEKIASAEGPPQPAPRRGRPPKSALQQQVKAASPPAPKVPPAPTGPFHTRFARKIVDTLLPDDCQTATPAGLAPHPAFIDLSDLPSHFLPDTGPLARAPPTRVSQQPHPVASRVIPPTKPVAPSGAPSGVASTSASPAIAQDGSFSRASSTASTARATPATDAQGDVEMQSVNGGAKRARAADDEGKKTGRKKARESSTSGAVTPALAPDDPANLEQNPLGPVVKYVLQTTTCLSKKIDGQTKCAQCIARGVGHGCAFLGVRSFGVDYLDRIVTPSLFRNIEVPDDQPAWKNSTQLTRGYNSHDTELLKTWLAPHLDKVLKREAAVANEPDAVKIRLDLSKQSICDTCNAVHAASQFMCQQCGRTACRICMDELIAIEDAEAKGKRRGTTVDIQRRQKCVAKKRGKELTGNETHSSANFVPLTPYDKDELKRLSKDVHKWHQTRMLADTEKKTYDYLRRKFTIPSNLVTYDVDTHPVNTVNHDSLSEPIFFELWRMGEPVLVRKVPRGGLEKFTPEYLAKHCASTKMDLVNNYGTETLPQTGAYFFGQFHRHAEPGKPAVRRADDGKSSFRTKDFPTKRHFRNELKELEQEFLKALPLPNILRPDGIYNVLAHAPSNTFQPDVGPRATNSWETNAKWGTTQLRTDNTDTVSFMYWGAYDQNTNKPLRIRWDVFKAEDSDQLREYLWDRMWAKNPKGLTLEKFKQQNDDPLLSPQFYLTKSQRAELWKKYGVKPFPVYQFEGDLVLIPAGCPYQVSSWIDHLNLTMSFLAGARVGAALAVDKSFSKQTKGRIWRQDNIQLVSQMMWTWQACDVYDRANPRPGKDDDKEDKDVKDEPSKKDEKPPVKKDQVFSAATDSKPPTTALPAANALPPLPNLPPSPAKAP
ncbi:hypothetical protein JCM10213_004351 [Rhodosporidiobolus nylandii]